MVLRYSVATGLGLIVAFWLFWVMQALIGVTGELKEAGSRLAVDFVRLRKDNAPEMKKREPPKREKPEQAPPPPEMNMAKAMNPSDAVGEIVPIVDTGMELEEATSLGTGGGSDRDIVPLVRVDPEYPPRAKQQPPSVLSLTTARLRRRIEKTGAIVPCGCRPIWRTIASDSSVSHSSRCAQSKSAYSVTCSALPTTWIAR